MKTKKRKERKNINQKNTKLFHIPPSLATSYTRTMHDMHKVGRIQRTNESTIIQPQQQRPQSTNKNETY